MRADVLLPLLLLLLLPLLSPAVAACASRNLHASVDLAPGGNFSIYEQGRCKFVPESEDPDGLLSSCLTSDAPTYGEHPQSTK